MSRRPAWFPSADGELLLRAALLDGAPALDAWTRWRAAHIDEQFDLASFRLLPLVYRNLAATGADDPYMGRLKGIYRRSWFVAQPLLRSASGALRRLEESGIPTLLLKGAGLAVAFYDDVGARPMDDVDVAVPAERALDALALLAQDGWRPRRTVGKEDVRVGHAETLVHVGDGGVIDLHWSVFWHAGGDRELWEASVPVELHGVATRTPCAADQVLHVCAHGAYWNQIHPLRWVADVAAVTRSSHALDWERLVRLATARELGAPLAEALGYVRGTFGIELPEDVPAQLRAAPARPLRRAAQRVSALPPSPLRSAGLPLVYLDVYRARARAAGVAATPAGFLRWLQRHLEVSGTRELAARVGRSFARGGAGGGGPVMAASRPAANPGCRSGRGSAGTA